MPKEKCWDLLLGTAIWSFCSASSHAQLTKTICVSHSPLSDPCRVFTFTRTGMIKIRQTNICFHFTASECVALGKPPKPQLLYIVLQFSEHWAWHVADQQSWRRGQHPERSPCPTQDSKILTRSPTPVTWADTAWINPPFTALGLRHNHEDRSETRSGWGTKVK